MYRLACHLAGGSYVAYWFGIFYPLFYLFDTITNVPYEALGPEISDSYEERSRIFFTAKMFNMLGPPPKPAAVCMCGLTSSTILEKSVNTIVLLLLRSILAVEQACWWPLRLLR